MSWIVLYVVIWGLKKNAPHSVWLPTMGMVCHKRKRHIWLSRVRSPHSYLSWRIERESIDVTVFEGFEWGKVWRPSTFSLTLRNTFNYFLRLHRVAKVRGTETRQEVTSFGKHIEFVCIDHIWKITVLLSPFPVTFVPSCHRLFLCCVLGVM